MLASRMYEKLTVVIALTLLLFSGVAMAQETPATPEETATELDDSVQEQVDADVAEKRAEILEEAVAAIAQSKEALQALDEDRTDDALEALAIVTGKLELIIARDPELALAPMDVGFAVHDLFATPETVEDAIDEAKKLLNRGEIQEARALLTGLGSEIVVSVANIPLATYPDAIKDVAPLIDKGEIEKAKSALQLALNTLVVTEHVIALPIVRAQLILEEAEALLENEERTEEDNTKLTELVEAAREQFEMADVLGYGEKEDLAELREEWDRISEQVPGDTVEEGFFAKIQAKLAELRDRIFD